MSTIKFSKYSAVFLLLISIAIIGYQEIDYRITINPSKGFVTTVFQYTFEIETEVQGIKTDLGFYNLKKNKEENVDLIALNQMLMKGDLIKIKILQKTKNNEYPNLICIKKGNDFVWTLKDFKTSDNQIERPDYKALIFLMIICIIGFFASKIQEQGIKSNKHQILKFPKKINNHDIYSRQIYDLSFSICNEDLIVFQNIDRINRSEVFSFNRITKNIEVNRPLNLLNVELSSIDYLIFQFDFKSHKQTYYEAEFHFQTKNDELIHIITLTSSNEIRLWKHEKTDFYKSMLSFAVIICQELDLKLKNVSSIKITNPNPR